MIKYQKVERILKYIKWWNQLLVAFPVKFTRTEVSPSLEGKKVLNQ